MQPETLNRSIQPTPTVHPRGFTPTSVQFWAAANIWRGAARSWRGGAMLHGPRNPWTAGGVTVRELRDFLCTPTGGSE